LLLDRFECFKQRQIVRSRNFEVLRQLMSNVSSLIPLGMHPNTRMHGMYMFAMRYRPEQCGGLSLQQFLDYVGAEGAPIYRAFASTISEQLVIQKLIQRRPEYFRRMSTPIADRAAEDTVYIAHDVFLGTSGDMEDIVAAVRKVEKYWQDRPRGRARKAA
jgi:dTDP-4-amino-4,6-dideoxygalactose transaminase